MFVEELVPGTYRSDADLRLDEKGLAADLGVSRTPVREALARLEHEGLVRILPRRGVYIVRKGKAEIIEMITVWRRSRACPRGSIEALEARAAEEAEAACATTRWRSPSTSSARSSCETRLSV